MRKEEDKADLGIRINHDCRPNADYYFDPESLTQYVHALRPIVEGEEITITYIK